MRISCIRAVLILACAALVVTAGAWQACASFLNLLPADIFSGSRAQQVQPASSSHYNFFSMALGMIPAGDQAAKQQVNGLLNMRNNYGDNNLQLPSTSSRTSWMGNLISSGLSTDISNSAAKSSYDQLIKRFENQSNIFVY